MFCFSYFGFSQKQELGKVTIDELKENVHSRDSSAVAAVLFSVGNTHFGYNGSNGLELITEIKAKIKIYKKEGYNYANQFVKFYIGNEEQERVSVSKANTYNLVNGKIEKTKLGDNGVFVEKINKFWSQKKIAMPNVREGSIIEFKFEITSPYERYIPDWEFQKDIPVNYSEFTTVVPEYYIYKTFYKGFLGPTVKTEKKPTSVVLRAKLRTNGSITKTYFFNEMVDFDEVITTYTMQNVPALNQEAFVNNINNYRASVQHELTERNFPSISSYESFSADWESVAKTIYDANNFENELIKTGYFEKDIDVLLNGISSTEEKSAIIFNYVKSRMAWNEDYAVYCEDGVKKAYKERKGNSAEINFILIAMLRYAGIETNPILLSTRSNGISIFPSVSSFNYVIAGVELQNKVILLDATDKLSLPNILPIRDLNWSGRIIRKNRSSDMIDLMPKTNSKEVLSLIANIDDKGNLTGKIKNMYFDYNAYVFRFKNGDSFKDSYVENLEKKHQGLQIDQYDVQNRNDLSNPIIENYDFSAVNSTEIIGDKMYFSPFLFFAMTENPFNKEQRQFPIDFVYPNQDRYNITIKIPDGYAIETLPKSVSFALPNNIGSFKFLTFNNGNQVQISYTKDINWAIVGPEYYDDIKDFYKEIIKIQTEKVVLKKI